jgi:hypothetical protein
MATTRLTDVYIRDVYEDLQTVNTIEKTAFVESGIAVTNPLLAAKAAGPGYNVELPFWRDLDRTLEPNYSSSDPTVFAVPDKVTTAYQSARVAYLNKSFQTADLAAELGYGSPMTHIRNRFGAYKQSQFQRRVIATVQGLIADNIAGNSGDMVVDVSIADGAAATDANRFGVNALIDGAMTLGDNLTAVTAIAVHSIVYAGMLKSNNISFARPSDGSMDIPFYMGKRVIVDDGMPVVAGGTSGFKYTSALFGPGAIGYGEAEPENASWVERLEQAGNGGGVETIGERWNWVIHPFGYRFTNTTLTGGEAFATLADLRLATNWERVVGRRNVPMAFLITNG